MATFYVGPTIAACQCGQLRVICDGDPVGVSMCHCTACQRRTGAPFSVHRRYDRSNAKIDGQAACFVRKADSGNEVSFHFCPTCGSTVYWAVDASPEVLVVAEGMFGDPASAHPSISVWEKTRHPWTDRIEALSIDHFVCSA